jgi:hypothetical protein
MTRKVKTKLAHLLGGTILILALHSCVGALTGAVVDTTIEVAKVPFKIVGAAVELVIPDDDEAEL